MSILVEWDLGAKKGDGVQKFGRFTRAKKVCKKPVALSKK